MKVKTFFISLVFLFYIKYSNAQSSDLQYLIYNVGLQSTLTTIGAIINKPKEKKLGAVILNSMVWGGVGGLTIYGSKSLVREASRRNNYGYAWASKFVNSIGVSVVENTARCQPIWSNYHLNFGFIRFNLHIKDKVSFRPMLLPSSLLAASYLMYYSRFSLSQSIKIGESVFLFDSSDKLFYMKGTATYVNNLSLNSEALHSISSAHEKIHAYQYNDFNVVNTFYYKGVLKMSDKSKAMSVMSKWIHYDFSTLFYWGLYTIDANSNMIHRDYFFEKEAIYFSK